MPNFLNTHNKLLEHYSPNYSPSYTPSPKTQKVNNNTNSLIVSYTNNFYGTQTKDTSLVITSNDGTSWTLLNNFIAPVYVVQDNNIYYLVDSSKITDASTNILYTSSDGISWKPLPITSPTPFTGVAQSLTYFNNNFIIKIEGVNSKTGQLNRTSYISTDGIIWNWQNSIPTTTARQSLFVANNNLFMAEAFNSVKKFHDINNFTICKTTTNDFKTTSQEGFMATSIVYDDKLSIYIMTGFAYEGDGDKKIIWWSEDGITWTPCDVNWENGKYAGFNYLVYAYDKWWASSYNDTLPVRDYPENPKIIHSTDGKNWSVYVNPAFNTIYGSLSSINNYNLVMRSYNSPYDYYYYDSINWKLLDNANKLSTPYLTNLPSTLRSLNVQNPALITNQISLNSLRVSLTTPVTQQVFNNKDYINQYTLVYNILVDFQRKVKNLVVDNSDSSLTTINNFEFTPNGVNIHMNSTKLLNDLYNNIFLPLIPTNYVYDNRVNYTVKANQTSVNSYNNYCVATSPNYNADNCQKYFNIIYIITIPGNYYMSIYPNDLYKSPYAYQLKRDYFVNSLVQIKNFIDTTKSELITKATTHLTSAMNTLVDSFNTPTGINTNALLESYATVTTGQPVSVVVPVPDNLKAVFTSNPEKYPVIEGSKLPINIATSTTNPNTGNEVVDVSNVKPGTLLVIPSLTAGATIEIGGISIKRGNGTNGGSNTQLDAGDGWVEMGSPIRIGDNTYTISGIGSPVIFTIKKRVQPKTLFDYVFMYSYFFAFLGCIFFAVNSTLNIDIPSIGINKNFIFFLYGYLTACGIIGLFTWLGIDVPFNIFNSNVVIQKL